MSRAAIGGIKTRYQKARLAVTAPTDEDFAMICLKMKETVPLRKGEARRIRVKWIFKRQHPSTDFERREQATPE